MIDRMDPSLPTVRLAMWRADAIVLFDWLMSVDLNAVPVRHPAEKQALADLLTRLEHETSQVSPRRSRPLAKRLPAIWGGENGNALLAAGPHGSGHEQRNAAKSRGGVLRRSPGALPS